MPMSALQDAVLEWVAAARKQVAAGSFSREELDRLAALAVERPEPVQQLLYLHARDPSVTSDVLGWARYPGEDPGGVDPVRPYPTVVAAMAAGWRVIHFPQQLAPFDDRETDIVGFEFVLERWE
ncbi:MAG: hypothetical protein FJ315_04970 [SAR202 cluster bacterium]|nr:hypothetical protein [SAR202 cluster bacterium]